MGTKGRGEKNTLGELQKFMHVEARGRHRLLQLKGVQLGTIGQAMLASYSVPGLLLGPSNQATLLLGLLIL